MSQQRISARKRIYWISFSELSKVTDGEGCLCKCGEKKKKRGKKWGVTKHKITVLETSYWDQENCEAYQGGTLAIH